MSSLGLPAVSSRMTVATVPAKYRYREILPTGILVGVTLREEGRLPFSDFISFNFTILYTLVLISLKLIVTRDITLLSK